MVNVATEYGIRLHPLMIESYISFTFYLIRHSMIEAYLSFTFYLIRHSVGMYNQELITFVIWNGIWNTCIVCLPLLFVDTHLYVFKIKYITFWSWKHLAENLISSFCSNSSKKKAIICYPSLHNKDMIILWGQDCSRRHGSSNQVLGKKKRSHG